MKGVALLVAIPVAAVFAGGGGPWSAASRAVARQECRPVDGAWAIAVQVKDAVTQLPVTGAIGFTADYMQQAETDSSGWLCIRALPAGREKLRLERRGYRPLSFALSGDAGETVAREVAFHRVTRPCCDLRGRWRITFDLESPGAGQKPTARSVSGDLELGPSIVPLQEGDDLDSLVHVVRGLHHLDFRPFFGGPVARDVSTSVFGGGPDLLREVEASVPEGERVEITFIPRMSHGSISLRGRIRADTVRGEWIQNAYCCGARGRFVMSRSGPPESTPFPRRSPSRVTDRPGQSPPATIPAGRAPGGRWRPELAIAPDGRLWMARGGLFVADSLFGGWRRVLGGNADPVEADELRIGLLMAFAGGDTALIGMEPRYPMQDAPVLYRTEDAGYTWSAVRLARATGVSALSAVGRSVWAVVETGGEGTPQLLRSEDGGRSWVEMGSSPLNAYHMGVGFHRLSASVAYLYGHPRRGGAGLWRTSDGGRTWVSLPTPHEQGLQRLESNDTWIEEIATVGPWILVREHGRVFVSPTAEIRWRAMPDVVRVASEPGGQNVFVLRASHRPALLDEDLRPVWEGARPLRLRSTQDIEQVLVHRGVGFVSETWGAVHEVTNGSERVLPSSNRPR